MADGLSLHLNGVKAFLSQIADGPAKKKVLLAQRQHVEQTLQASSFSVVDAAKVAASLRGVFGDEDTQALLGLLADKTATITAVSGRSKLQNYTSLPGFLPKEAWSLLLSDRSSSQAKMDCIIAHTVRLQLRNPSEGSVQIMTAIYIASTEGLSAGVALCASTKYSMLKQVKRIFKNTAKPMAEEYMLELPSTPDGFRKAFPVLYERLFTESPPTQCPLDTTHLGSLAASIPMRSTSRLMGGSQLASGSQAFMPQQQHQQQQPQQLVGALLAAFQQMMQPKPAGIKILRPVPRADGSAPLELSPSLPARDDTPRGKACEELPIGEQEEGGGDENGEDGGDEDGEEESGADCLAVVATPAKRARRDASAKVGVEDTTRIIFGQLQA